MDMITGFSIGLGVLVTVSLCVAGFAIEMARRNPVVHVKSKVVRIKSRHHSHR